MAGARSFLALALLIAAPCAHAAPSGGQIISGAGSITQTGATTTIRQTTPVLSLDWRTFNIAPQETVDFLQPSALAIAVNRIFDTHGTQILGHLNANGQVYLINPNGILFGKDAQVNIGGLVASTLNVDDSTVGKSTSTLAGAGSASVVNTGTITASNGGYVALVGNHVSNQGVITAQMGSVALASGSAATLTFSGNSLLHLRVDQSVVNSVAENGGLIRADGGQVIMTAGAKNTLLASVVNNSGVIQARTMENHGGSIVLLGATQTGEVSIGGTLDVSSTTGHGGEIVATGHDVSVAAGASVQATGATGGGTVNIGGGWEGGGGIDQATTVDMSKTATINASATARGNGGDIIVRSDVDDPSSTTRAYGTLLAHGGASGGNGGNIETSGHWLDVTGSTVDASASHGVGGEWLLDPYNVIIAATGTAVSGNQFVPSADSTISASSIGTVLNNGTSITIYTGTVSSSSLGDITVNSAIQKTGGAASILTLQAADSIIINQPITNTSAAGRLDINLDADNQGSVHDGVGVVILNNSITTKGGFIAFGNGDRISLTGLSTEVGGDIYVGGSSAITLSTAGGAIGVHGQMIIANSNGISLNTANGNVTFDGLVDSGDSYAFVTATNVTWPSALAAAKLGGGTGANIGDTYLATITSRLENAVAGAAASYVASWLGAKRVTGINTDAIWRWVAGPEGLANGGLGQPFFTQAGSDSTNGSGGSTINSSYINWNSGEPNNFNGQNLSALGTTENVMQFVGTQGQWNDLSTTTTLGGYLKETNLAPSALNVSAGTGVVTFTSALGSNKPLASLAVTAQTIALNSSSTSINTTGAQTFTGQVTVNGSNVNLLTVSANNSTTTYGLGLPTLSPSYSGFVGGDTTASLTTPATISTTAPAHPNVGLYPITASGVVDPNYFIVYNPGSLIVNPATLTITASSASRFYGQANPAFTVGYSGFMYTDTTASLTTAATASTTATAAANAGAYAVTAAGAVPSNNYTVAYVNGTLTVNPATLTISGLSGTARNYNASLVDALSGTGVLAGLISGQTLTLTGTNATLASANVGSEALTGAITLGNGTGGGLASNYVLTQPTLGNVTITQAPLSISGLTGTGRSYNASTVDALSGTGVLAGLFNGETLTLGGVTNATLGSVNAGSEALTTAITLGNGTGGGLASNYVLTQPTLANVTITRAPLTVSGLAGTARTYDAGTVDALSGTGVLAGLFGGQTLTLGGVSNGTLASANAGSEALTTAITLVDGTGLASNYLLTQPTMANVTIAPAPLTVSGLAGTARIYNASTVDALSGTGVLSGLFGSQTLTLAGVSNGTLASANAGNEALTTAITLGNGTAGGLANNYVLTQPTLPDVTIAQAPLTVSGFSGTPRSYNGSTLDALTGTGVIAGLIGGQTLTLASTNATLASANAGSEALTTSIILENGSGLASNYVLTQPTLPNVTIAQASLSLEGLSGTDRTYNGTTIDALTGTASLSGLLNGETLTLGNTTNGTLSNANAGSEAVSTAVTLGDGTGLASNYLLTQSTLARVTIAPAPLTVTGLSGTSRSYNGGTVDALTGTGTLAGLVNGETLTLGSTNGTLASANAGSEALTAVIALGDGTGLASNYELTQPTLANVTITQAFLSVSGLSGTARPYNGSTIDTLTGTPILSGLINGQTLTLGTATGTLASANAGSEALTATIALGDGTGLASNYALTQPTLANVTITPAPLTVSGLSGTTRTYSGGTIDALTGTGSLSGLFNGEALTLGNAANGTLANANAGSEALTTAITLVDGTGLASNYALTQPTLANVTITPAPLTVSGLSGTARTYNSGTADALTGTASLSGLINGQTLTLGNTAVGILASPTAGSEPVVTAIVLGDGTGLASNYVLTQSTLANVPIAPAALTVSGTAVANKVYDGTREATLTGGTLTGVFAGDTVTLTPAGSFASKNAGPGIAVTAADTLAGSEAVDYTLTQPAGLAANITALAITATATGANKVYDGSVNDLATLASAGVIAGDAVSFTDTSAVFADKNVGNAKNVAVAGISASGVNASNYSLTNTVASTSADITQLGSVAWVGPASGGSWSNPANWAGGAIPDLSNVANVLIPTGASVTFDASVAGPVDLDRIGSGGLIVAGGILNVATALNLTHYAQSGGTVGGTGSFTVTNSFSQSAGQIAMGNGAVSITQAQGNLSFANISAGSVALSSPAGAVQLGNLTALGNLGVTARGGTITQSPGSMLDIAGTTALTASNGGAPADIDLANAGNMFAQAVNASGREVSLSDDGPLTLGTVNASANLNVSSSGALDLGTALVGGSLMADSGNGNVTQDGALFVAGTTDIAAGAGSVQLTNAGNTLLQAVSASGQAISLADAGPLTLGTVRSSGDLNVTSSGALDLGTSAVGGNLVANSGNGNVTQDGVLLVTGTTDIAAGTGSIQLTKAGNTLLQAVSASGRAISLADAGPLKLGTVRASADLNVSSSGALDLGTSTVGGNLIASSGNGNVTQDGALLVTGTTDIAAGTGSVQLTQAGNALARDVSASGRDISLNDAGRLTLGSVHASGDLNLISAGALDLGASTVGGSLVANSGNSDVTQDGALLVTGTTDIAAGTGSVQLTHAGNVLLQAASVSGRTISLADAGPLTLGTVRSSGDLNVASSGALDLGTSAVDGNLVANSGNGNVTQDGALFVTGTSHIAAGTGSIRLTNAGNTLVQVVNASGGQVSVTDSVPLTLGLSQTSSDLTVGSNGALDLGTATVGGNLVANSGNGNVTQGGALHVAGTTDISAGTGSIQLNNPGNVFASTVTASGGDVGVDGKGPGLPLHAGLTSTSARNAVSQLESSFLAFNTGAESNELSLSPTVSVIGSADSNAPEADEGSESGAASGSGIINVTTKIGPSGPTLRIVNGGLRLPAGRVIPSQYQN